MCSMCAIWCWILRNKSSNEEGTAIFLYNLAKNTQPCPGNIGHSEVVSFLTPVTYMNGTKRQRKSFSLAPSRSLIQDPQHKIATKLKVLCIK